MLDRTNSAYTARDYDRWERLETWAISVLLRLEPTHAHPHYAKAAAVLNSLATGTRIFGRGSRITTDDWLSWVSAEGTLHDEPPDDDALPPAISIRLDPPDSTVREFAYLTAKIMDPFGQGKHTQDDWLQWCCLFSVVLERQLQHTPRDSLEWELLHDALLGKPQRSMRAGRPMPPSTQHAPS